MRTKPNQRYAQVVGSLLALTISSESLAGPTEIRAAEAIATTITYYEKCTGDGPTPDKMERLVRSLLSAGMTPQDFATGSKRATSEIERLYPGRARPPQRVCTEAVKVYIDAFGAM